MDVYGNDRSRQLIQQTNDAIDASNTVLGEITQLREKVVTHSRIVNGFKTVGTAAIVPSAIASIFTGGLFLLIPMGIGLGGAAVIGASSIADIVKSKKFLRRLQEIIGQQTEAMETLKQSLEELQNDARILSGEWDIPEHLSVLFLLGRVPGIITGVPPRAVGFGVTAAFAAAGTMDDSVAAVIACLAREGGKIGGATILRIIGNVVGVAGAVYTIGDLIYGWVKDHPNLTPIDDAVNGLQRQIFSLTELLNSVL